MSQRNDVLYQTTKVSVRRLVVIGALSGMAVLGSVAIASASTSHSSMPKARPLHGHARLPGARPVVDGKVTGLEAGSFTVLDRSATSYTVTVKGTTIYRELNQSSVGIGDVKTGSFVDVLGSVSGTTVTATVVRIEAHEPLAPRLHPVGVRPAAAGRVTAIGTKSFTIENRAGTSLTVDVTDSTTFEEHGVASASFGGIKTGNFAVVSGTITGTTIEATDVHFGDRRFHGGPLGASIFGHMQRVPGGSSEL